MNDVINDSTTDSNTTNSANTYNTANINENDYDILQ